jgi:two-component system, OmpR family, response regulator MprA
MPAVVLVVDDEPGIRAVLAELLIDEGYRVVVAQDGVEALRQIGDVSPDLVLLDLNMPKLTGWEVVERLRALAITLPIVIMTAGQSATIEAARLGAAAGLPKPFTIDDVLTTIERLVPPADDGP